MVSVAGIGCKQYREQMDSGAVPELSCPNPECQGARLRGHGWYKRYLGGERQSLRRVRCPRCRVSHAVLPEDVCAYRDLTLASVEAGLAAGSPSAGAEASGQDGSPGVRRVRGWLRSAQEPFAAKVQGLLGPVSGPWWRGAQEVVGQGGGLADAAAALAVVELALFSRRGERAFPPRPAVSLGRRGSLHRLVTAHRAVLPRSYCRGLWDGPRARFRRLRAMDETLREKIALFRYGVIAELIGRTPAPREKEKLLCAIAAREWSVPGSRRTRIGRSTVRDWIELYQTHGFEGLKPGPRADAGRSRAIPEEVQELSAQAPRRASERFARQPDPRRASVRPRGARPEVVAQLRAPLLRRPGGAGQGSVEAPSPTPWPSPTPTSTICGPRT